MVEYYEGFNLTTNEWESDTDSSPIDIDLYEYFHGSTVTPSLKNIYDPPTYEEAYEEALEIYPLKTSILLDVLLSLHYECKLYGKYDHNEDCAICTDTLQNTYVLTLPCGHPYHRNCILKNIYQHKRTACPNYDCKCQLKK